MTQYVETARTKQARAMRAAGLSFVKIADNLGISTERARQIIRIAEQYERGERGPPGEGSSILARVDNP